MRSSYDKECNRRLKQYRKTGVWKVSLEDFRRLLDVPESYRISKLNEKVLKPIEEELGSLLNLKVHRKYLKKKPGRGRASLVGFEFEFDIDRCPESKDGPRVELSASVVADEARKSLRQVGRPRLPICRCPRRSLRRLTRTRGHSSMHMVGTVSWEPLVTCRVQRTTSQRTCRCSNEMMTDKGGAATRRSPTAGARMVWLNDASSTRASLTVWPVITARIRSTGSASSCARRTETGTRCTFAAPWQDALVTMLRRYARLPRAPQRSDQRPNRRANSPRDCSGWVGLLASIRRMAVLVVSNWACRSAMRFSCWLARSL